MRVTLTRRGIDGTSLYRKGEPTSISIIQYTPKIDFTRGMSKSIAVVSEITRLRGKINIFFTKLKIELFCLGSETFLLRYLQHVGFNVEVGVSKELQ